VIQYYADKVAVGWISQRENEASEKSLL